MLPLILGAILVAQTFAPASPEFDPVHPDRPLRRCTDPRGVVYPTARGRLPAPTHHLRDTPWGLGLTMGAPGSERDALSPDPQLRIPALLRLGDLAYDDGQTHVAVQTYYNAAALQLRQKPTGSGYDGDRILLLARALYLLGDVVTADRLWRLFLDEPRSVDYSAQTRALTTHRYREFFRLALLHPDRFTDNNPTDLESGGVQWIYAGAEAGKAGHFAQARSDFQEALNCHLWFSTYAQYAWAAASYALGNAAAGTQGMLAASVTGDTSPNDPFSSPLNGAPISALLSI